MSLNEIESLSATYAAAMDVLASEVAALDREIRATKHKRLPAIKRCAERAANTKAALQAAIKGAPDLFKKPRTKVLHGVKVGFEKGKGKVVMDDEDAVIRRIRKLLPDEQAELLIRSKENVHKPAVYDLSVEDLKRLGIEIKGAGDQMVVRLMDSDIEKIVDALLKGDDAEEEAA